MMRIRYNESYLIKGNEMENFTTAMLMNDVELPHRVLSHDEMIVALLAVTTCFVVTLIAIFVARFKK